MVDYTKKVNENPDRILKNYEAEKLNYFKEKEKGILYDRETSMACYMKVTGLKNYY